MLDGALALALPTKLGQAMEVSEWNEPIIKWEAYDVKNQLWFSAEILLPDLQIRTTNNESASDLLLDIFKYIAKENPSKLQDSSGLYFRSKLDFPNDWGLGSSSTFLANLARWAEVDALRLQRANFKGSGYDIACASASQPLFYQLQGNEAISRKSNFAPRFRDSLYFVFLGKKMNSRTAITRYEQLKDNQLDVASKISLITKRIVNATTITEFNQLLLHHEHLIADALKMKRIQEEVFSDYNLGVIKSLGAWGGDFVMATSSASYEASKEYFNNKGFDVFFKYEELIK